MADFEEIDLGDSSRTTWREDPTDQDETSFIDDDRAPLLPGGSSDLTGAALRRRVGEVGGDTSLRDRVVAQVVDEYYREVDRVWGITPSVQPDPTLFEIDPTSGQLVIRGRPDFNIINSKNGLPLALNTISSRRGGSDIIKGVLGFKNWRQQLRLSQKDSAAVRAAEMTIATIDVNTTPSEELDSAADTAVKGVAGALEALRESNASSQTEGFELRELEGLDKALRLVRGELELNVAKLSELDRQIAQEREKLADLDNLPTSSQNADLRDRIQAKLDELISERAGRLEVISGNREALRSQISRIRETFGRMLHENTTLAERIRTLFREQGITVVSILTAIGLAIATLVEALTGTTSVVVQPTPTPPAPPTPSGGGVKDWVKKQLEAIRRLLVKLAEKAAAALPGVIGAVVSWLLTTVGKVAGWLAQNLWAVLVGAVALLAWIGREVYGASRTAKFRKNV